MLGHLKITVTNTKTITKTGKTFKVLLLNMDIFGQNFGGS